MPNQTSSPFFFHQRQTGNVKSMEAPQHLSRQAVDEFKAIFQEEFHKNLSDDEAQEIALRLLCVFNILLHPVPRDNSR